MTTAISYIFAHWFLILSVITGTVALVAFAWFAKNWKAAVAAVVLVMAGLFYQSADIGGYKRALDERKAEQIRMLNDRIATLSLINAADTQRVLSDAKLNNQLEDLSRDTPPNTGACLDRAAAGRVRSIGPQSVPGAVAPPARRHPKLLPFSSKHP